MSNTRKYWNSLEQYNNESQFVEKAEKEFAEELPVEKILGDEDLSEASTSRRDFLKFVGFGVAAASLAACETPVIKSIPYVVKPEEVTPGIANYYASTFFDGSEYCSILVKTREGRPIFIKGNAMSPVTGGAISARSNSSVLGLYDSGRLTVPTIKGADATWSKVDEQVVAALKAAQQKGGKVRFLSQTEISPSTKAAINQLASAYMAEGSGIDFKHVQYDAVSYDGMIAANEKSFGKAIVPDYKFQNAKVIVSFGADFTGTWLNGIEYNRHYVTRRKPEGEWMSRHYQFEGTHTMTGSGADIRGAVKPSQQGMAIATLYNMVAKMAGKAAISGVKKLDDDNDLMKKLQHAAKDLWKAKGAAIVIAKSNDVNTQVLINGINDMLMSYGSTIDLRTSLNTKQGRDQEMINLVKEMNSGKVDVLFVYNTNPVYSAKAYGFEKALSKVKTSISFADRLNETGSQCTVNATDNHFLESWNDFNPKSGEYSLAQPTISPLFNTRQAQQSLLKWAGDTRNYYDFIRENWKKEVFANQNKYTFFDSYWNQTLHDGVASVAMATTMEMDVFNGNVAEAGANVIKNTKSTGIDVELVLEYNMGEGQQANNPWLQELAHSVSRITWDNYIAMNPTDMTGEIGNFNIYLGEQAPASLATLKVGNKSITLPVVSVPGQRKGAVSIALGYGRTKAGKTVAQGDSKVGEEKTIGQNAFDLLSLVGGSQSLTLTGASIEATTETYPIASTQTHHTMMGRKIVNETSLQTFKKHDKEYWNPSSEIPDSYGKKTHTSKLDLWSVHDLEIGHRWGMTIDLTACNGCGACVTACHIENNVPVVGKDEVRRTRTMNWLRIDRYFSSDMTKMKGRDEEVSKIDMYGQMEIPSAYPETVYQPVMCQHCNHAPCETVCPVAATTHSNEGLNQMTYNRCIGTRYCANNCPYKVRRFNWFNYIGDSKFSEVNPSQDDLGRMVLNPDVVVRSRGVMEKCSFCVQNIQAAKLTAKKEGRKVREEDVDCACGTACSNGAISFGDLNDKSHTVTQMAANDRSYNLLEEVGTQPNVYYMTKIRNVDEERVHESILGGPNGVVHGKQSNEGHDDGHESHDDHGHKTESAH